MPEISHPVRLLWLTQNYYPKKGGMAQACDRIVHTLRKRGVYIELVHFDRKHRSERSEQKHNGRYVTWPIGDDTGHTINMLWNMLNRDAPACDYTGVVSFGGIYPLMAGPVFATWIGVPHICMMRGNDFDTGVFSTKTGTILREALLRSQVVCCVSRDKVDRIRALYPQLEVVWTPNGIDLDQWQALESDHLKALQWRKDHVAEGHRVVGIVGQIKSKKGVPFLIEVLAASGVPPCHLLVIGDVDEETGACLERVAHTHYPFMERFELIPQYLACDLVAIPSFYDGLPNVLLEAAALGVPLLASRVGGMADLLQDREHGFLFEPGDKHGCHRAAVEALSCSTGKLQEMGMACRNMTAGEYNHVREADRYLKILQRGFSSSDSP